MSTTRPGSNVLLLMAISLSAACSRPVEGDSASTQAAAATLPAMIVHKTEGCGCCEAWIAQVRLAGFRVEVRDEQDLGAVKQRLGVPEDKSSCHTALIDGYLIEGHVPVADIRKLLQERPDARGLVVAGMPLGSPGMEASDGSAQAFVVELVGRDGSTRPYSEYAAKPGMDAASR